MVEVVALSIVAAAGLFLLVLGTASLFAPSVAGRFLFGFAGSPAKHYAELAVRLLVGGALLVAAPGLPFAGAFTLFGWVLLATTAGLLLIPWRWHHRFAQRTVPKALRFLPLIGVSSVVLGGSMLWAVFRGNVV